MEGWRVKHIYNRTMELIRTGSPLSTGPRDRPGARVLGVRVWDPAPGPDRIISPKWKSLRARHARRNGKAERNAQITKTYLDTTRHR